MDDVHKNISKVLWSRSGSDSELNLGPRHRIVQLGFCLFQSNNLAMHHAAMRGHADIMQMLIDAGSKIEVQNIVGW